MVLEQTGIEPDLDTVDAATANETLEEMSTVRILEWAYRMFGKELAVSSSFQTQSMPLLHLVAHCIPHVPVLFLDTGFHFPETLEFRDRLAEEWGLNVLDLRYGNGSGEGHQAFRARYGNLYERNPDECCRLNKVEPMNRALRGYRAWISGIRRDQTELRRNTPILSIRNDGHYKLCPMARWTEHDVMRYINRYDLPVHPLLSQGYMSVGCAPCTRPTFTHDRSGRWSGSNKTECGLHGR